MEAAGRALEQVIPGRRPSVRTGCMHRLGVAAQGGSHRQGRKSRVQRCHWSQTPGFSAREFCWCKAGV